MENHATITKGFAILRDMLAPYIAQELSLEFGSGLWWRDGVMKVLYDDQKRSLPESGDFATVTDSLDIALCLLLFADIHWRDIFKKKLSIDHRTWAKELMSFRNKTAHIGGKDFSDNDTWRALDTMSRLCEQIDAESSAEIRGLLRISQYGTADGSTSIVEYGGQDARAPGAAAKTKNDGILKTPPVSGLPNWRDVIEPHPDVAQGRYKNAEFAADLAQVSRGEGAVEYRDPVEFFARTFVTEGMTGLLEQSLRRVCGRDGEPVIQLKTAFGGGKTHSMLAIYHMMRGTVSVDKIPNIKPVLERAGVSSLPKANVAVVVGTALDPSKSKVPSHMPGITVSTIWGEIAAQLAYSAGKPELYDYVKESDKKHVSPGSEALKRLFDDATPCIVLLDEIVAYARKIYGKSDLPSGTFDNFITFIQEITEAARASKNSLVVAAIPESNIEIGGEEGCIALETIEHTFGRMESIWKPVAASEGFEVVRRRLFLACKNPDGRDAVCAAFSKMYNEYDTDFPLEAKELDYRERMASCYPIHPEVFDRLYKDWSTLERFQRTRGVLRLMAAVIYELWMGSDAGLMIMPGSVPLDVPNVRDELTRHLSENWNGIVDREVDGKDSIPYKTDKQGRYGRQLAARRVARTVMLGSAPTGREQILRGIESSRIRLGVVQPGENIAVFNDALNTLRNSLSYLYTNPSGDRYWYDNRPTLRKTAEDRAQQQTPSDVEFEIEGRLRKLRREPPFAGLHICPTTTNDVPDEQTARLVVLRPTEVYKPSAPEEARAMTEIGSILDNRGTSPRICRNMLAFVAPDQSLMEQLTKAVRRYLAWKSIQEDSETLNLDATQNNETAKNLAVQDRTVDDQIKETYCWLIVPYIDRSVNLNTMMWDVTKLGGKGDGIVRKAALSVEQSESVISRWAPMLLKMQLDDLLWKDSDNIEIKKLWECLSTYCYLPRLADYTVLENAIREGLGSSEFFAYAAGIEDGRYVDLKLGQFAGTVERSGCLVKTSAAKSQIEASVTARLAQSPGQPVGAEGSTLTGENGSSGSGEVQPDYGGYNDGGSEAGEMPSPPDTQALRRFFMSADLDTTRIGRDVQKYVEEVIQHLTSVYGARVAVSLEVEAECDGGFTQQTVRTVTENCKTLQVRNSGFES